MVTNVDTHRDTRTHAHTRHAHEFVVEMPLRAVRVNEFAGICGMNFVY